jgi:hypothetical protein
VLYGPTRAPLPGTWAVLEAVRSQGRGGAVDSVRTGRAGEYHVAIPKVDTSAFYVVSNWYHGIAYFSEPVPLSGGPSAALQPILVYDTTSTGPPIEVVRRLVTIQRPKTDGTRSVLEFLELQNPGHATRITNDTTRPVWTGGLPHGTIQFDVGQGDIPPDAVGEHGDSVLVVGPIPPGDPKQLSYTYTLPATVQRLTLPIDQPTGELDLLLEDTTTVIHGPALEMGAVQAVDEHRFARYRAKAVPAGTSLELDFPNPPFRIQSLVPEVVGLTGLALAFGLFVALRRPLPVPATVAPPRRKG